MNIDIFFLATINDVLVAAINIYANFLRWTVREFR